MYLVQQITDDSFQEQTLILSDGSSLFIQLRFSPQQYGWFITELSYTPVSVSYGAPSNYSGAFTINGLRITNSPNMLRQFKNQLPFGLACFTTANREPSQQQDFSSGTSNLYILSAEEVSEYESYLTGALTP